MESKHILKIFIIVLLILSLIIFINTIGLNLNDEERPKKLLQVVTIESLENKSNNIDIVEEPLLLGPKDFINTDLEKDFCNGFKGSGSTQKLNEQCAGLTNTNCVTTSCCVLANGTKCLAGSANGPTFLTNLDGSNINVDYYYYQGKCYGSKCPN